MEHKIGHSTPLVPSLSLLQTDHLAQAPRHLLPSLSRQASMRLQDRAAASAMLSNGRVAVTMIRFAHVHGPTRAPPMSPANHAQFMAVNSSRDSLNVGPAPASGSRRSAMTWRRGEQDLQHPLPYGDYANQRWYRNVALRTLTSLWRCRR